MDDQSTSDTDDARNKSLPKPPKKRKKGYRCLAGGCSNTGYADGFSIHHMPGKMPGEGERFTALQKAWMTFIGHY